MVSPKDGCRGTLESFRYCVYSERLTVSDVRRRLPFSANRGMEYRTGFDLRGAGGHLPPLDPKCPPWDLEKSLIKAEVLSSHFQTSTLPTLPECLDETLQKVYSGKDMNQRLLITLRTHLRNGEFC